MKQPRIAVDFNEMIESDLVLLSRTDTRTDSSGAAIALSEGLAVHLYEDDVDAAGRPDKLIADGTVERNGSGVSWGDRTTWCCRIDSRGVRHESED
jgi:hypothetical protein